jgi:DNA-binding NarL/FixJ family response regulator
MNDPPERFAEAILEVAAVGYHISARLAVYLRDDLRCRPLQPELADADRALLDACADGDLSAEIAARAGMSSAAVSAAFTRVFGAERRRRSDPRYRPTAREEEVMILAGCAGLSDQAIARQLGGINTETVTSHLAHLKSKYQRTHPDDAGAARISPRATAVRWARDLGLCLLVQVFRDSGDASSGGRMGAGSKFPVRERSFVSCVAADY